MNIGAVLLLSFPALSTHQLRVKTIENVINYLIDITANCQKRRLHHQYLCCV